MMEAYRSGDPYLAFGKQAGADPARGDEATHGAERELFKACVLGVQYGMGAEALARRIGRPAGYWPGSCSGSTGRPTRSSGPGRTGPSMHAMLLGRLHTVFGWTLRVGAGRQPAVAPELPLPGERGRDAPPGLLPGDGAGDLRRGPGP